jgi:hypothetical protein
MICVATATLGTLALSPTASSAHEWGRHWGGYGYSNYFGYGDDDYGYGDDYGYRWHHRFHENRSSCGYEGCF